MAQMFQALHRTMKTADTLKAECEACGRRAAWRHAEAKRTFGPDAMPAEIRARLTCSACGGKAKVWI